MERCEKKSENWREREMIGGKENAENDVCRKKDRKRKEVNKMVERDAESDGYIDRYMINK